MALSPLEKMKVQKELKATKAALMAATNPLDKLKLQKERKALWSKLKVNSSQSAPEPSPAVEPDNEPEAPISVDEFSQLDRAEQIKQLDALLKLPNWYEYEQAFNGNYKVVSQGDGWVVFESHGRLTFGYRGHISRDKNYWKKEAGSVKANGGHGTWSPAYRSKAIKEIEKAEDQIAGGKEAGKQKRERDAFLASLNRRPEKLRDNDYLLADRFNIYAMGDDFYVDDRKGEFDVGGSFPSLNEAIEDIKRAVINQQPAEQSPTENNLQNPMLEQYREGGFSNQPAEKFKLTMQQVYDLGMSVDEVGAGMIDWFRSNTDQLAA